MLKYTASNVDSRFDKFLSKFISYVYLDFTSIILLSNGKNISGK